MNGFQLTEAAVADLNEIFTWRAEQSGTPAALKLRKDLFSKFQTLADFPGMGHSRADLTRLPLVFFAFTPYVVVYEREGPPILIHAVFHSARDLKRALKQRFL